MTVPALQNIDSGHVDICLLDHSLPEADKSAVIGAAQNAKHSPLVLTLAAGAVSVDGADGFLPEPETAEAARKILELCIRLKTPTRVLLVDDSKTMRAIVRKILSASRYALDIFEASDGNTALAKVQTGKFSLVLIDYNMPGLNGVETLSEIKRKHPKVAVVMMTSAEDNAVSERARAAGAFAFLRKPFYPADVKAILQNFYGLNRPRVFVAAAPHAESVPNASG
jgi:CheY-like chemotaxis protein